MLLKHAIATVAVTWFIIIASALGIAVYRSDLSTQSLIEYSWGVSFAVSMLGVLLQTGASRGDTVERTEGVAKSSLNRDGYQQADIDDAVVGYAFGTIVMTSALLIFASTLAILYFFFKQ